MVNFEPRQGRFHSGSGLFFSKLSAAFCAIFRRRPDPPAVPVKEKRRGKTLRGAWKKRVSVTFLFLRRAEPRGDGGGGGARGCLLLQPLAAALWIPQLFCAKDVISHTPRFYISWNISKV